MTPAVLEVQLEHVRLSALTWGATDGPLALLLHGFPDSAHTWRHLGPALGRAGWRAVAPFTRGYAPSGVPSDGRADIGALVDDAVALHSTLGGDGSAVLVGHDWGALTAHTLAAHPDSPFRRVVTMAVPPLTALPLRATLRHLPGQARRSWYVGFNQLPLLPERSVDRLVPRLWRNWSPGYDATHDVSLVLDALPDSAHRRTAIDYYRHLTRPIGVPRRYRRWQQAMTDSARVPVLYLHGRDDGCMTYRFAEIARSRVPRDTEIVVVDRGGHFLHLEQPAEVEDLIVDFLRR